MLNHDTSIAVVRYDDNQTHCSVQSQPAQTWCYRCLECSQWPCRRIARDERCKHLEQAVEPFCTTACGSCLLQSSHAYQGRDLSCQLTTDQLKRSWSHRVCFSCQLFAEFVWRKRHHTQSQSPPTFHPSPLASTGHCHPTCKTAVRAWAVCLFQPIRGTVMHMGAQQSQITGRLVPSAWYSSAG